jgi:UDP-galactopyranose mutase
MRHAPGIVTFSHLRWNFVYQRPQHLLTRLAKARSITFLEEPVFDASRAAHWEKLHPEANLTVLRPHTPVRSPGFHDEQMPLLRTLLSEFISAQGPVEHAAWLYTPMALPLLEQFQPQAVIYDCMDELAGFLGASPQLAEREKRLFEIADVVFTGGRSLYRAKKDRHHNIHCFPSSVDTEHFARGVVEQQEPPDQAGLTRPRLGYYGVIDERIDLQLLDSLAQAHPEWEIVLVGPVVKIDPASLPRRPNLHYLGQRDYTALPGYLKGWDVCLLPFALNAATRFISPTKTLEYMAAGRLIVSTPITDVAEPYGRIVYLGDSHEEFVRGCEAALRAGESERQNRIEAGWEVVSQTSWDRTASAIDDLVEKAILSRRAGRAAPLPLRTARPAEAPVVVVGAGPTGLSAAYHLGDRALVLEQNDRVGGWCRSVSAGGFTFDFAGHIMFSDEPYVHQLYQMLLGDNVHWQDREAWIYSQNVYTRYPFQGSLYGLPPEVIKECLVGAIEARFGPLKPRTAGGNGNGGVPSGICAGGIAKERLSDCCADGILESSVKLLHTAPGPPSAPEPQNFEEFIYRVWGRGIAKHFALPYNKKLWAVPLREMETSWLGGRVPLPDLEEMLEGALKPAPKPMGPNARFGYPLRGGFQSLMDGFLPYLQGRVRFNSPVLAVSPERRSVTVADGTEYAYTHLINTMPLPLLVRAIGQETPAAIREAAARLRHVSVRCVHLGVGRERLTEKHWIYYPEDTVFHRIFVQGNASPYCNPPGGFGITCEITYSEHKPLPCQGQALIERTIADCHKVGMFRPEDPVPVALQCDLPYAYVVYDHARQQAVETIRAWLAERGILLAGRYSEWAYYNSDHAFIAGKKAAEAVRLMENKRKVGRSPRGVRPEASGSQTGAVL